MVVEFYTNCNEGWFDKNLEFAPVVGDIITHTFTNSYHGNITLSYRLVSREIDQNNTLICRLEKR